MEFPTDLGISNHKIAIINALSNYFLTTVQKSTEKKFSCYTIYIGKQVGIYSTWNEVKEVISGCEKTLHCSARSK